MPNFSNRDRSGAASLPRTIKMSPRGMLALTSAACFATTGCQAVEGIFKAGFWVGAIAVIVVIALVVFVLSKVLR